MRSRARICGTALAIVAACSRTTPATCPVPAATGPSPGSPTKIMQLVGELDRQTTPPTPTRARTESTVGIVGTDLGFSFMHKGRLYFLFGDTIPVSETPQRPKDCDSIAWSDDFVTNPNADQGFDVHFLTEPDAVDPTKTAFQPVRLDGHALGTLQLPTTGFSDGVTMYVFFVVGGKSVLGTSSDDGKTFQTLVTTPSAKLENVMPVVVASNSIAGLDTTSDKTVLVWGRHGTDAIYLAEAPLARIGDASTWRFYAGLGASGNPVWSTTDANAVSVVAGSCGCNGNFSITYVAGLDRWLMLNRCDDPHAIFLRASQSPMGPWSDAHTFFDRQGDSGVCHFMHRGCDPSAGNCCDSNFQAAHDGQWGPGQDAYPYAPFIVDPYTRWDATARVATLYFLMSVWNPYSPMLMKATLPASAVP